VKALFKKYDTDGSGDIDAKEFQILAFDLGLVLTDDEAKTFVKELDTDGNGTTTHYHHTTTGSLD
jgi:Ca2+-binding EF-hand superfamily protein